MPIARVQLEDGRIARFEVPEGATEQDVLAAAAELNKPAPKQTDPVLNSPIGGLLRGLRDPIDAGAQLLTRGIEAISPAGSGMEAWARRQRENVEGINRQAEQDYRQNWRGGDVPSFDTGRVAGNVAATLPLAFAMPAGGATMAGRLAAGAGQGAAIGTLAPVDPDTKDFWGDKVEQAALGGVFGAGGAGVAEGLSRVIAPKVAPEVKALMDRGVTPTPGQIIGGAAQRAEEGFTSVPVLGDSIRAGQRRAVEQFNIAALDDALSPLGKSLPKGTEAGRDAVKAAGETISQAYDDLLPKLTAAVDQQFLGDLVNIASAAKSLPPARVEQLRSILDDKLVTNIGPNGVIPGEALKKIESELGRLARTYGSAADADQRLLGSVIRDTQGALRDLLRRSNPAYADQLAAINDAYSRFLRVENAAGRIGAQEGVFSPAQLNAAVRQMDGTRSKRGFARGDAVMQDLATQGQTVLGAKVPDSGTPFRVANMAMMGGGYLVNPALPLAVAAGSSAYTPLGQQIMATLLARRPAAAQPVADNVRRLAPLAAALSASSVPALAPN